MQRVVITKGLPASGKSTWAKEMVAQSKGTMKRVNKDTIRMMLGSTHSRANEKVVVTIRDAAILAALNDGFSVIVDDTNLAPAHVERIRQIAGSKGVLFEVNESFLEVPLETCIARDLKRDASVGKDVIYRMYTQYIAQPEETVFNEALPDCILVDLDGTLADFTGNPYDRDWSKDICNRAVAQTMRAVRETAKYVIIMSGRDGGYREPTEAWLAAHGVPYDAMHMRTMNDNRKDTIVKRELFDAHIRGKYNVSFVIDDRPSVVRMWRHELGLTVFQVAPDIDF